MRLSFEGDTFTTRMAPLGPGGTAAWGTGGEGEAFWVAAPVTAAAGGASEGPLVELELFSSADRRARGRPVCRFEARLGALLGDGDSGDGGAAKSGGGSSPPGVRRWEHVLRTSLATQLLCCLGVTVEVVGADDRADGALRGAGGDSGAIAGVQRSAAAAAGGGAGVAAPAVEPERAPAPGTPRSSGPEPAAGASVPSVQQQQQQRQEDGQGSPACPSTPTQRQQQQQQLSTSAPAAAASPAGISTAGAVVAPPQSSTSLTGSGRAPQEVSGSGSALALLLRSLLHPAPPAAAWGWPYSGRGVVGALDVVLEGCDIDKWVRGTWPLAGNGRVVLRNTCKDLQAQANRLFAWSPSAFGRDTERDPTQCFSCPTTTFHCGV